MRDINESELLLVYGGVNINEAVDDFFEAYEWLGAQFYHAVYKPIKVFFSKD